MTPRSCPGPNLSRRQLLQIGAANLLGLGLPSLLKADASRSGVGKTARADACIIIF